MARKYLIETFGCQMNVHDSERMSGLLDQAGYEETTDPEDADLVVLNTCSVRERAAEKMYSRLGELKATGEARGSMPLIAVAGCVAQQEGEAILDRADHVDVIVGTQAMRQLPFLVEQAASSGEPQIDLNPYDDVSFPMGIARRADPVKAYVTILEGCNDYCSFCVVPYTRGRERMRSKAEILADATDAVRAGKKEVVLLGQIVNHYQAPDDPDCDFPALLALIDGIPGVERVRFASPHPRHVSERLISAIRDLRRVCKHLHLPVQSGSTRILEAMRRRHTREEFLALVERLRHAVPGILVSTDMIVGFPGETEADFADTLSLTEKSGFSSMYSFKYSQRPGTLAAKRLPDDVPEDVKGRRLVELQALQKRIQWDIHHAAVGEVLEVLIDSRSRRRASELAGRTSGNVVVNLPGEPEWVGRTMPVKIKKAGPNSLWGEVVQPEPLTLAGRTRTL
jgi:tRNA-2-methylthio-N6-dimethylallyladenosine synthase